MANFTEKQGQYLAFIHTYTLLNRRPPSEADMQAFFRVTPPTVHQMVIMLESQGLIRRRPGVARSIEVLLAIDD
jgi:Mn-dependent DtxR family transcriptional regulator